MSLEEEIKEALKKDFNFLYVKEFTTNWQQERVIREIEITVMELDNVMNILSDMRPRTFEEKLQRDLGAG